MACTSAPGDRIAETHDGERTEFTLDVASPLIQVLASTRSVPTNTDTGQVPA